MSRGFSHCLQIFPTPDMAKTAAFYELAGFRAVHYLESSEPHVCLYRDGIEIVLTRSIHDAVIPNQIVHGYGYDAYFIAYDQLELERELAGKGIKIVRPLTTTDYNNHEFVFEDVDGRWIAVGNKAG
ncbi:MAG: glyoxalase [Paenibacillus dendritiformis]|uniref:VOC family protein n=1 Tax=uncultured Paenibacillus sp. TaxID=227322 RepID=UPI0025F5C17C|nr:VOC family protein [uncultured Paenibacillus sp.]MDU5145842.1 glyoxalase [Paenibacillus dendritiformis]